MTLHKKCVPCEGGTVPFGAEDIQKYMQELPSPWELVENKKIWKEFSFPDFKHGLSFVNAVGDMAEAEGHHPDLHLYWDRVVVELKTHAIHGLSENDFILAAKIEHIMSSSL